MISSAPGSANAIIASAEVSTTLSAIAHLAHDRRGALAGRKLQRLDPLEDIARRHRGDFVGGALHQIEELALERAAVPRGAGAQALDDVVGDVLDGEARRHGSIIDP